ncbi:MAG TPA: methyltransferase domain-containing protein [Desulfuromonadaceae bacterium]|jgi:predicted SAM-dependent methyltransferase
MSKTGAGKCAVGIKRERLKVLNVGGNSKAIAIPDCFDGWRHDLLDIDPRGKPDVLCDARELWKLPPRQYDAIYCSHNLEHYHKHDVRNVLKGFRMILKKEGYALIRVPDIRAVMQRVVDEVLDIDDILYQSPSGPILVNDVIYGWHVEIERSGNDFFAHKTGFTRQSLERVLKDNGFPFVFSKSENLEVTAFAFMQQPGDEPLKQLGLI